MGLPSKSRATPAAARPAVHSSSGGKGCHARGAVGKRRAEPRCGGRGVENTAPVSGCRHGGAARRVTLRYVSSRPLRRTAMSTPVPIWGHRCQHGGTIGQWSPCGVPSQSLLSAAQAVLPRPAAGGLQAGGRVGTEPAQSRSSLRAPPPGATLVVPDRCRSDLGLQAGARLPAAAGEAGAGGAACTGRVHCLSATDRSDIARFGRLREPLWSRAGPVLDRGDAIDRLRGARHPTTRGL